MKHILLFIFLGLSLESTCQIATDKIVIGTTDSVYSGILNESRKIFVYVPSGSPIYNRVNYPVVYLLDGESNFNSVVGMTQFLSEVFDNTVCPKMIIVGIINTDRTRDLTPTNLLSSYYGSFPSSGGSEKFSSFIEKELIPYIDAHYSTAPYRILIGHSFGGLFTVATLTRHPGLFNAYVAIDPSLWWDNQLILKEANAKLGIKNSFAGKSLYLAVANTVGPGASPEKIIKDTSGISTHMRGNLIFGNHLSTTSTSGLHSGWKYYGDNNHGTVPLIAEYDALHFLFDYYQLPKGNFELMTAEIFEKHYKNISEKLGYRMFPPEGLINNQGYIWLNRKIYDKAYAYFKLNIESYPTSFNAYDSMADYYIATGDSEKAIENLEKELSIKDNPEVRIRLGKLKNK